MQIRIGYLSQFGSAVLVLALIAPAAAQQIAWDGDPDGPPQWCAKAKTKVEKLICEGGQLGEFDKQLDVYYQNLLKMVPPSVKADLVQSQKKWIAEREKCDAAPQETENLASCIDTMIQQRSDVLLKDIQQRNIQRRLSEFAKFQLRTFRDTAFEFQYPSFWNFEKRQDGRISLKSGEGEMIIGFENMLTSLKDCTYWEKESSEDEIRRDFYEGKRRIGGQAFDSFQLDGIPNGEARHYYGFFNGRCFAIHVSDWQAGHCIRIDYGKSRANCEVAGLELKDLMAYSDGVIRSFRFVGATEQ